MKPPARRARAAPGSPSAAAARRRAKAERQRRWRQRVHERRIVPRDFDIGEATIDRLIGEGLLAERHSRNAIQIGRALTTLLETEARKTK